MKLFACSKCGESYSLNPPDNTHTKLSNYPDRNTIPVTTECKVCGSNNITYWKAAG